MRGLFEEPKGLDIRQTRLLLAILLACTLVALVVPHWTPEAVRFTAFAVGALLATFLHAPLQRVRLGLKTATIVGSTGMLLPFVAIGALAHGSYASAGGIVAGVLLGILGLGGMLVADRMRVAGMPGSR